MTFHPMGATFVMASLSRSTAGKYQTLPQARMPTLAVRGLPLRCYDLSAEAGKLAVPFSKGNRGRALTGAGRLFWIAKQSSKPLGVPTRRGFAQASKDPRSKLDASRIVLYPGPTPLLVPSSLQNPTVQYCSTSRLYCTASNA